MSSNLLCHVPGQPGFPETKIVNPRGGGRERKKITLSTRGRVEVVLLTERVSIKRMLLLRLPSALPETANTETIWWLRLSPLHLRSYLLIRRYGQYTLSVTDR
jgi:hypothetical protein